MTSFSEKQRASKMLTNIFGFVWLLIYLYARFTFTERSPDLFALNPPDVIFLVGLALMGFMYAMRLDTRFDETGVHYRLFPILGWRTITWANVQKATMISYPLGYGLRHVNEVYNAATRFNNNDGLRIQKTNGKTVLIGTHRPDELKAFLGSLPMAITA